MSWQKSSLMFLIGVMFSLLAICAMHYGHVSYSYQGDSGKYMTPALSLFHEGRFGYMIHGVFHPELERLPLYPLFIFSAYWITGFPSELAIVLCQSLLMGAIVVAIALTTHCMAPRFTWIAVIVTALCPNLFFRTALVLPDLMFAFFVAWGLCFLILSLNKKFTTFFILSALCIGLGLMTRPALILYPILTFPFMVYLLKSEKRFGLFKAILLSTLFLVTIAMVVSPQLVRQKQITGQYMLTVQSGNHALFWLYPCMKSAWGGKRDMHALQNAQQLYQDKFNQLSPAEQSNPAVVNNLSKHLAMQLMGEIPKWSLMKSAVGSSLKLIFYTSMLEIAEGFHHQIPHTDLSLAHFQKTVFDLLANPWQEMILVSQLLVFLLRGVQIVGVIYGLVNKQYRALTLYYLAAALSFVVVSIGIGNPRYRVPIEPEFIVWTILGFAFILDYLKHRKKNCSVGSSVVA